MKNIRALVLCLFFVVHGVAHCQENVRKFTPVEGQEGKNVPWIPTPQILVDKMLDMAEITSSDFLIDLGSGDGRLVITAAKRGTKALGIEYNPEFVALAKDNAEKAGVASMVQFEKADVFEYDFSKATVLTMFLLPELNIKLRPKILNMKPGTRIITNTFTMQDWKADETVSTDRPGDRWNKAYMWIVPAHVSGEWTMQNGNKLILEQKYQMLSGSLTENGNTIRISSGKLRGNEVTFTAGNQAFTGMVSAKKMEGSCTSGNKTIKWAAGMNGKK
jgi:precorrin-6B methylase 2